MQRYWPADLTRRTQLWICQWQTYAVSSLPLATLVPVLKKEKAASNEKPLMCQVTENSGSVMLPTSAPSLCCTHVKQGVLLAS